MTVQVLADTVSTIRAPQGSVPYAGVADVLAYIPSPPQGVWQLGPFPLRAYAICIIIGIVVAIWWGERRWQARGGEPGTVLDVAVFAVPFGLIGGRLYHVATDWQKYFGADGDPMDVLKIYQGGLGIWGAVFLGGIGAWLACRIYRIPLSALGDAVAPPILLAQAIGRLGNYFNQELYGRETDVPWGLQIFLRFDDAGKLDMMNGVSSGEVQKIVHPTFLYELLWNVLVVLLLVWADRRFRIGHGRLFALYVAGYSFGRFFVELMRDDEATLIAGIRINSFTSALVFLAALAYFLLATKGRETPAQLQPGAMNHPWPWQPGALRRAGETSEAKPADGAGGVEPGPSEVEPGPSEAEAKKPGLSKSTAAGADAENSGLDGNSGSDDTGADPNSGDSTSDAKDRHPEAKDSSTEGSAAKESGAVDPGAQEADEAKTADDVEKSDTGPEASPVDDPGDVSDTTDEKAGRTRA